MQKFLNIKGTAAAGFEGNQLVNLNGVKTVRAATATATTTVISYVDGTATTITTAAILNAVETALATSWQKAYANLSLPKAVTSIVNA